MPTNRNRQHGPYILLAGTLIILLFIFTAVAPPQTQAKTATNELRPAADEIFCRYGANALEDPALTDLPGMGLGWYMNFRAQNNPPRPAGMEYMPTIRFEPSNNAQGYTYEPSGAALTAVITSNPNAKWIIGNEPDSTAQDSLTPETYARAYNELYHLIKGQDPNAQILAGSIVQATAIRLEYLDRVLVSYQDQFNEPLPADGWSIHNYILREMSCDYDPFSCWGARIPPGIDAPFGELWGFRDHDRLDIFAERIVRFRQWMASRGYRGQPLYLTEYGVLFTPIYADEDGNAFTIERVNNYMTATFDYMNTATDMQLGNPNDGYRLVQQWSWFSTTDDNFGGTMFTRDLGPPITYTRTGIGDHYADYIASNATAVTDFYPSHISGFASTEPGVPVTVTVSATIANSGSLVQPITATVGLFDGDPDNGGTLLATPETVILSGCGDNQTVTAQWPDLQPGTHELYVQVTPGSSYPDTNPANNIASSPILVATEHTYLPTVSRALPTITP